MNMSRRFRRALLGIGLVVTLALAGKAIARGQSTERPDYGSLKPVMGWSSWSFLREHPTEARMKEQAKALVKSGLVSDGYVYVNLDDYWYECAKTSAGAKFAPRVNQYGLWVVDKAAFPDGMSGLVRYVHSLGLKFGIYATPGISMEAVERNTEIEGTKYHARDIANVYERQVNYNCGGMVSVDFSKPGAQAFINSEVKRFSGWGVDFVKVDGNHQQVTGGLNVAAWAKAIRLNGRKMVFDATEIPTGMVALAARYANQWEAPSDVECYECEKGGGAFPLTDWSNVELRFRFAAQLRQFVEPGSFMDLDAIDVGNGAKDGLTLDERKTVLSLWSLASSPLLLGADLTQLDSQDLALLKNKAVIGVDQDEIAARRVVVLPGWQVFEKATSPGRVVVGMFNTGAAARRLDVPSKVLGLEGCETHGCSSTDLWTHEVGRVTGDVSAMVPAHGVALFAIASH